MNGELGRLYGKSVIITGGTQGIGKASVLKFAKEGANVLFCYLKSKDASEDLMNQTSDTSGSVIGVRADIRDREQVNALIKVAAEKFDHIDVVINNAHQPYERKWFEDASWEEFQREIEVRGCSRFKATPRNHHITIRAPRTLSCAFTRRIIVAIHVYAAPYDHPAVYR